MVRRGIRNKSDENSCGVVNIVAIEWISFGHVFVHTFLFDLRPDNWSVNTELFLSHANFIDRIFTSYQ